jgi:uncharacterized phage protein (TIGR01671 family)
MKFNQLSERGYKVREILFKAKGRDNGEWVEGYYVLCRKCHYILPIFNSDALYHGYDERYDEWIEIEPSTICQYTGLTDKNGLKIWEGDIVECVYDGQVNVRKIIWDDSELNFKGTNGKNQYGTNYDYLSCCEELVIMGNIYDSPNLLN